jgi:hypothetical protein
LGVIGTTTVSHAPQGFAALMRTMFGADLVLPIEGGFRLAVGLSSFDCITPDRAATLYGSDGPEPRDDYMACLTFRVGNLQATEAALTAGDIRFHRDSATIRVPASETMGATLEFMA